MIAYPASYTTRGRGYINASCLCGRSSHYVARSYTEYTKNLAVGIFGLLSTAIVYHGIYNILIQSDFSIVGALLPIATYIPLLIWRLQIKHRLKAAKKEQEA